MVDKADLKVVLKHRVLNGSIQRGTLQKVAIVYIKGEEYRVLAPSEAKGDALDWTGHFSIRRSEGPNSDIVIQNASSVGAAVISAVEDELGKEKQRDADRALGMHPDGIHHDAQICLSGHVLHCKGSPFSSSAYCTKCGARCIDTCPACGEPIRGVLLWQQAGAYSPPGYCHGCGHPYPWMEERMRTVDQLIKNDDKLSPEAREELLNDLNYIISDPRAPLVPAKKKLVSIKLEKATQYVREFVLDYMAKATAEIIKNN